MYEPALLPVPSDATIEHAHGIVINHRNKRHRSDSDDGDINKHDLEVDIVITYKDAVDDTKCLLHWSGDALHETATFWGPTGSNELCQGIPHGLVAVVANYNTTKQDDFSTAVVLYHANNQQTLHKTTLHGDVIWSIHGKPDDDDEQDFQPTWFAAQPGSPYLYLADGYGSSRIYVYHKNDGSFTGFVFGGKGTQHGMFQTSHSISWDPRVQQMVVCDRENHRLEYFNVDKNDPSIFVYNHTVSFYPLVQRPCNLRIHSNNMAILPALEGTVAILNKQNEVISLLNISQVLGEDYGFLHPHDAHFIPGRSGDFVLATWNPGRIGYFRRINSGRHDIAYRID